MPVKQHRSPIPEFALWLLTELAIPVLALGRRLRWLGRRAQEVLGDLIHGDPATRVGLLAVALLATASAALIWVLILAVVA